VKPLKLLFALAVLGIATTARAASESDSPLRELAPPTTAGATRACRFTPGGWTIIDCSAAAAASSAQLNAWTRYVIQCGDDSYFATGTATGQAADTNDGWIPSGAWLEFMTDATIRFVSVRNKNSDSDCRIMECK
jgi:hypothetical protein